MTRACPNGSFRSPSMAVTLEAPRSGWDDAGSRWASGPKAMDDANDAEALLAGFSVAIAIPVQWGDQDAFAHVNNVVFFRWFESARIAYFRRIGLMKHLDGGQV